ncbi:MAG: TolC family protein [Sphingobacterium sp.]|jgi:outer membrane protein TolC|nr:TolC family protein [Sphingobacterium sp.]
MNIKRIASISFVVGISFSGFAQTLDLKDALKHAVENYDKIKSKQVLVEASAQNTLYQQKQYLPDVTVAAQQSYGTINAQNGPLYAYGGLASAATSMPLADQNWNAAFGSLYFANVNWNIFTFGRLKKQVDLAVSKEKTATADVDQEIFQHQVKVSAAYLNLLATQRIKYVQRKNFERAEVFYEMTNTRAKSGLIPEVDASLAKAEVSNARSMEIKSFDKELEFSKQLAVLMGEDFKLYVLDSIYSTATPAAVIGRIADNSFENHPFLLWQQSKIDESKEAEQLIHAHKKPNLSGFGVIQGRGSGFDWNYVQDNSAYSSSYLKGVGINRGNFLLGVSLSWNITNLFRYDSKVNEQRLLTKSLEHDYDRMKKDLDAQSMLAKKQITNSFENFEETKVQLAAAQLAYKQHTALYENGLTTLVDFTQALYSLHRAEIDFEIAQNNVWQSLLLLAAADGDLTMLLDASVK